MIKRDQGQSTGALELDGNQQRTRQLDYLIILNDKRALPYENHKRKQNMMIFGNTAFGEDPITHLAKCYKQQKGQ